MTRKCVLCKETNYRNTYSFFSAPKDPEMRKKWQNAISIENYEVNDDTYVCSKHFHKDDIITHWVSGVPPHVITIKYKKCRLRPGAVPGRNFHLKDSTHTTTQECSDESDIIMSDFLTFKSEVTKTSEEGREAFCIPRTEEKLHKKCNNIHRKMALDYRFSHEFDHYDFSLSKKHISRKTELSKVDYDSNTNTILQNEFRTKSDASDENLSQTNKLFCSRGNSVYNTDSMESMTVEDTQENQNRIHRENSCSVLPTKIIESSSKVFNNSEGEDTSVEMWDHVVTRINSKSKEKILDTSLETVENMYKTQVFNTLSYERLDTYYPASGTVEENEMLFEDLLEVCTEVLLPRGWSCLVTSKGRTTTIVYLFMGMTKNGMPFVEKQVFVKSDMILRCATVNREINPLIHNLTREGKHIKIQSLLDIEELIDEFNQRIVCQGIHSTEGFKEINGIKIAYKDGIKWRHVLCPLIINNDSSRCTKCITLTHMLGSKPKRFLPFSYNPLIFVKRQQKLVHSLQSIRKRTKKRDRRYEFIKVFKNK